MTSYIDNFTPIIDPASYAQRISTLETQRFDHYTVEELASRGLYYDDDIQQLTCFCCNLTLNREQLGSNLDKIHADCSFFRKSLDERTNLNWTEPNNPDHSTYESRIRTYEGWPIPMIVTQEKLSEAGFFYNKKSDKVHCYHCDSIFKSWVPEDDPLEEHAKWQPDCFFLQLVKDEDFLKMAARKAAEMLPAQDEKVEDETDDSQIDTSEPIDIEESDICKICFMEPKQILFIPCGHFSCVECGLQMTDCPHCRSKISAGIKPILF